MQAKYTFAVIALIFLSGGFYFFSREASAPPPERAASISERRNVSMEQDIPDVAGYYSRLPENPNGEYILVTQQEHILEIKGFMVYVGGFNGSKYYGSFNATSTISREGTAQVALDPQCIISLFFQDERLLVRESASSGFASCPFGTNVSFNGEFERQAEVPDYLPVNVGA